MITAYSLEMIDTSALTGESWRIVPSLPSSFVLLARLAKRLTISRVIRKETKDRGVEKKKKRKIEKGATNFVRIPFLPSRLYRLYVD